MRSATGQPVTTFPLPEELPAKVASARDRFLGLVAQLETAAGELRGAAQAVEVARRADIETAGRTLAGGAKAPADAHRGEREARAAADEIGNRVADLESGVDQAGNLLAQTIEAVSDEWLEQLRQRHDKRAARFRTAINDAATALDELAGPAAIIPWLEGFAAWKLEPDRPGAVQQSAIYRRILSPENALAFSGVSALVAALDTPPAAPTLRAAAVRAYPHEDAA